MSGQWVYCGFTVGLHGVYNGFTLGLQCPKCFSPVLYGWTQLESLSGQWVYCGFIIDCETGEIIHLVASVCLYVCGYVQALLFELFDI